MVGTPLSFVAVDSAVVGLITLVALVDKVTCMSPPAETFVVEGVTEFDGTSLLASHSIGGSRKGWDVGISSGRAERSGLVILGIVWSMELKSRKGLWWLWWWSRSWWRRVISGIVA